VAARIGGKDTPEVREKYANGHTVLGMFKRGSCAVFTTGCTDWADGLRGNEVAQVTRDVLEQFIKVTADQSKSKSLSKTSAYTSRDNGYRNDKACLTQNTKVSAIRCVNHALDSNSARVTETLNLSASNHRGTVTAAIIDNKTIVGINSVIEKQRDNFT
jgi:hypothetical protein